MTSQDIQTTLKAIDDFWGKQNKPSTHGTRVARTFKFVQSPFESWQGYGWRLEETGLVVSPFVDELENLAAIEKQIAAQLHRELKKKVRVQGLVMPYFREIPNGPAKGLLDTDLNPFQPGNPVLRDCSSACNGTIGAFLTTKHDGNTWMLSNRHVLADCPDKPVLGIRRVVLGTEMRSVAFKAKGNLVDAAVIKVENRSQVDPSFKELGKVEQPNRRTMIDLREGTAVRKFGNITRLTSGKLVLHCPKVKVKDRAGTIREFQHQFAIVNGDDGAFADKGDSGSLVVSCRQSNGGDPGSPIAGDQHAIGLLFAMNTTDGIEIPKDQFLQPPFYLANRWDNVMRTLSKVVGLPLELMLEKTQVAVG